MKRLHEQQAEQIARAAGVAPLPPRDEAYLYVSLAAFDAQSVIGVRCVEEGEPFTGWRIVATSDDVDSAKFGYFSTAELEAIRPEWMMALALPTGWSFAMEGATLVQCTSPAGVAIPMDVESHGGTP
ncbi:MAG TPA: hypothetical protein VFV70_01520 [Hyphomonadaceae bacterium]|nr:hypothetical protein [Hyphomonadaceae bacterium]